MTHDSDYFHRRAAQARAACHKQSGESTEVAGDLALAYAALARRRSAIDAAAAQRPALLAEEA